MDAKNILLHFKASIYDEYSTLFLYTLHIGLLLITVFLPFLIIYSCFEAKAFIIIWLLYYSWIYYDSTTLKTKGRKFHKLKFWFSFKFIRDYFSLRLIKTADIPSSCNYIFACYPHAVIPNGMICNFFSDVNKFTELFSNIDTRLATLDVFYLYPLLREYLLAAGGATSNEANIKYLLNSRPSIAIIICPGGIRDLFLSHPGKEYKIYTQRKGFVRIALQTGTPLVPIFTFGEQNTHDTIELKFSIFEYFNSILHKYTRIKLPLVNGRGFFLKNFGLLPRRCPLTTVVGEPIQVPKVENPSAELIDEYHKKFFESLYNLFENNKQMHDEAGNEATLIMI